MTIKEKIERDGFRKWIAKLLLIKLPLAFVAVTVLWVLMLKWVPVWVTPLTRSFVRKAFEAYFTLLIEWIWGKERILEVYLNVAEMGKGVYGAEAAARAFFDKNASELTRREASLITACLPNPIDRHADRPSQYVSKRAGQIRSLIPKIAYPEWIEHE